MSPSLSNVGKGLIEIAAPNVLYADNDPEVVMTTELSGFKMKFDVIFPDELPLLSHQFLRSISLEVLFLNSINSDVGNPLEGVGSA